MMSPPDDTLPEDLRALVEEAFGLQLGTSHTLVDMGDECDIWRVDGPCGRIALRVSPTERRADALTWSHRLLTFVAGSVPEAIPPLTTPSGKTLMSWEGRPVSLYPWAEGEPLTRESASIPDAAGLLARLHRVMRGWREPSPARQASVAARSKLPDDDLDRLLLTIERSSELVRGAVHGDYYPRNLICRDERIVTVIDWDESHDDLLAQELAWSVWEFAQDASRADLDIARARAFVTAYAQGGGPVPPDERQLIVPLIRRRLREEVDQAAAWVARGRLIDRDYMDREVAAFHSLREVKIEW